MSAAVREAFAQAINGVDGLDCTPYPRTLTKPGNGYVSLLGVEYPDRFGGLATWVIYIVTKTDEKYADALIPDLYEAVHNEMTITSITPASLGNGSVPCVVIQGVREME